MSALISKIIIFFTVLISLVMPGDVNGAEVKINNEVKTTDSVIEYTYTNETGYVIKDDCWVEKLEVKVLDSWIEVPVNDTVKDVSFYVNPGAEYSKSYDAGMLAPGTYRLTVGYNVITEFSGASQKGFSSAEFSVALY